MTRNIIEYQELGCVEYREALNLQASLVRKRIAGEIGDRLLLLEHPPVITRGKRACDEDFLTAPNEIEAEGIPIVSVNRGGRLTYHGPGQLIGYCIFDVVRAGRVKAFVRALEEVLIGVCGEFGVTATRDDHHPGVWVGRDKVAALGLHINRHVSSHGFSLNVNCDLQPYRHIVPCGIAERGVTSIQKLSNGAVMMDDAVAAVLAHIGRVFRSDVEMR